eukprot:9049604-Pyramimonas_sp.AAC.1
MVLCGWRLPSDKGGMGARELCLVKVKQQEEGVLGVGSARIGDVALSHYQHLHVHCCLPLGCDLSGAKP